MPNRLTKDPESIAAFFARYKGLLIICNVRPEPDMTMEGKELIAAAREQLGYAPSTNSFDIMRALLRHFRGMKNT